MKKRIVSLMMVLIMWCCLFPSATKNAKASYSEIELRCYANGSGVKINNVSVANYIDKGLRRLNSSSITADFKVINEKTTRDGYIFLGWYTASSGGTRVTSQNVQELYMKKVGGTQGQTGKLDIYAHWVKIQNTITATSNKRTVNLILGSSGGHKWSVYSIYPSASWLNIEKLINYDAFRLTIAERTDSTYAARGTTICFRDNYGNDVYVNVSQAPNYKKIQEKIDNTITGNPARFENLVNPSNNLKPLNYNMGYARWFQTPDKEDAANNYNHLYGCCTNSAMMDLLNRRLAADGLLKKTFYFDIRDILNGISGWEGNASWRYDPKNVEVCYVKHVDANNNETQQLVFRTKGMGYLNGWHQELSYNNNIRKRTTFKNNYGSASGAKSYNVSFRYYKGKHGVNSAADMRTEMKKLLDTHPEGIYVYSYAGGEHALLVVGYEGDTFKYVDNGAKDENRGIIEYSKTCFAGKNHKNASETYFLEKIFTIAYVE